MATTVSTLVPLTGMYDVLYYYGYAHPFIDGNKLKSCRTGLTDHIQHISHHIMLLVINGFGCGHTDTQTHTHRHTDTQTDTHTHTH